MASLDRTLRKNLENEVKKARKIAEAGAKKSIELLCVHLPEAGSHITEEQRKLRNRLRAHGKQLGDFRDSKGAQQTTQLESECAYEHWHRMLFARFLAENDLLIEPGSGMALSLDECKELAREQGADWLPLASQFAQKMLPQIFRTDDPVLEINLPQETRLSLEKSLEGLSRDVFLADDSLGWVYQFWQAERKEEVNASGNKIGADELPAVTQLFTEDYMVDFLLDNTLGAWHAGKVLSVNLPLAETAKSEEELRKAVALPGCPWKYLRFSKDKEGRWTPTAGTFSGWPKTAKELKCLDPCMGSGHFVVAMFSRLVSLRVIEEKLDEQSVVDDVIQRNIFGLEIDPRCTQIGAFNLALAVWRLVGYRSLPAMNLACSGLAPNASESDWIKLAGNDIKLQNGMSRLYKLFKDAPILGSLINPYIAEENLLEAGFKELRPLLEKAVSKEVRDEATHEMAVIAYGLAKAAEILVDRFVLVATNVPYLARGKQNDVMQDFCERYHPEGKHDLATSFLDRCLDYCQAKGTTSLVIPQNWLFQSYYKKFREKHLHKNTWHTISRLGAKAFQTPMWDFNVQLLIISRSKTTNLGNLIYEFDVSSLQLTHEKSYQLINADIKIIQQENQLKNPDNIITTDSLSDVLLQNYVNYSNGIQTGDSSRFIMYVWEVLDYKKWNFLQTPFGSSQEYAGLDSVLFWESGNGEFWNYVTERLGSNKQKAWIRGLEYHDRRGIAISATGSINASFYSEAFWNDSLLVLVPHKEEHVLPIFLYCCSKEFERNVRAIDQKLNVRSAITKVHFDLAHWQQIAGEKYPNGAPKPFSSNPTQWIFNGNPKNSDQPLQVAVARLLGYEWPRQTGSSFPGCPSLAYDGLEKFADADGIVCLPALQKEAPAADRLRFLLAESFGTEWSASKQNELLASVDHEGKTLEDWLRDGFFEQHCELFHQRPFIWHVWDGRRDGFNALVNYHKLVGPNSEGKRTLEKLIYTYLGDWIDRQRTDQKNGVEGADGRVASAEHLKKELEKILVGEPPYDIFVRWKPLHQQAIGWDPDINVGVRLNIRPFMTAKPLSARGKNACILRANPTIKWDKDRGKEPERPKEDFPWFRSWDEKTQDFKGGTAFDGNRWNDLHYSNAIKQAARDKKGGKP